ncbi:kinase-like domain-containing protein [Desarmillaria tabescens]|uniref:Kinase-like domain-containing protein n=1 Tax=Armillaria tabescens TaxID=1929756 RepID=A0AA39NFK4_ARMTA|nr:kinase-like domain-containing protein [Desarmillaria tabescens]KAK0464740.1 kinase-like domain-containing protein [Desarmillaria tabescens]
MPSSFFSRNATREGTNPVCGGGFADIWKGRLHDTQVCLKVLRIFVPEQARTKILRDFCKEALVWRQLRHPNILPFLGVNEDLFTPSYCLISPWMVNGNIMSYLEAHPDHNRLTTLIQVAEGMKYLHNLDPPVVHSDIRGANILVMDDLCCCLADFGLSLFAESQAFDSSSRMSRGSIRWLALEYINSTLLDQSYLTARDIYAYGCTVLEIFTGKPPFSNIKNDAGVIYEVLTKQGRPPRPPLNLFPYDELWLLVTACLATVSSQRPNAEQILESLHLTKTAHGGSMPLLVQSLTASWPGLGRSRTHPYSPANTNNLGRRYLPHLRLSSLLTSSSSMPDLPTLDDDRIQFHSIFTGFNDDTREFRRSSLSTLHLESRRHAPYPRPSYTSSNPASYTFPPTSEVTATTYAANSDYWNNNLPGIVRPSYPTPMLRISGQQRSYPSHSLPPTPPPTLPALPLADSAYQSVGPDGALPVERPQRKRGKLPKETTDFLKAWLHRHSDHPYPTKKEERLLCDATGLSMSQVSNWVINARRRILTPARPSPRPTTTAPVPSSMGARRASLPVAVDSLYPHPMH